MKLSPHLMARLARESHPTDWGKETPLYVWQGSYTDWLAFAREVVADDTAAGRFFAWDAEKHCYKSASFSGIGQHLQDVLTAGCYQQAFDEFKRASARLEADRYQPGVLRPMPAGGAWVVPLVLSGNPLPARIRERSKLPPRSLQLAVNVSCFVKWQDITASLARIARASWDYVQAGGAVDLTVNYIYRFRLPQDGHEGLLVRIRVPLTNQAAFASACSAQEFRGLGISLARTLSGYRDDSLPIGTLRLPGLLHVSGKLADDKKAREALKIV